MAVLRLNFLPQRALGADDGESIALIWSIHHFVPDIAAAGA